MTKMNLSKAKSSIEIGDDSSLFVKVIYGAFQGAAFKVNKIEFKHDKNKDVYATVTLRVSKFDKVVDGFDCDSVVVAYDGSVCLASFYNAGTKCAVWEVGTTTPRDYEFVEFRFGALTVKPLPENIFEKAFRHIFM